MKHIIFPAPQLSYIKEIDLDLDMTGRHFVKLASSEGRVPEEVALDIISDLTKQDANNLTLSELRYAFMLVKINSLENDYSVEITCTHTRENGEKCNHTQTEKLKLSDADLNRTPKNYKVPTIKFVVDDGEEEFTVFPPKAKTEIELINWMLLDKGYKQEDLTDNIEISAEYTFLRGLLHLQKNGEAVFENASQFEEGLKLLDTNKYQTVTKLYSLMNEVDSYGVQNKIYRTKCKECGGTLVFALPLLHGLTD